MRRTANDIRPSETAAAPALPRTMATATAAKSAVAVTTTAHCAVAATRSRLVGLTSLAERRAGSRRLRGTLGRNSVRALANDQQQFRTTTWPGVPVGLST